MKGWHPLDGNMIAADRYYNQPDKWDFERCDRCGELFAEDYDDDLPQQSDKHWNRCILCEDDE